MYPVSKQLDPLYLTLAYAANTELGHSKDSSIAVDRTVTFSSKSGSLQLQALYAKPKLVETDILQLAQKIVATTTATTALTATPQQAILLALLSTKYQVTPVFAASTTYWRSNMLLCPISTISLENTSRHVLLPCQCNVCSTLRYQHAIKHPKYQDLLVQHHNAYTWSSYYDVVQDLARSYTYPEFRQWLDAHYRDKDKSNLLATADFVHLAITKGAAKAQSAYRARLAPSLFD